MRRSSYGLALVLLLLAAFCSNSYAQPNCCGLSVPLRGQIESNWCWAACSEMLLAFYQVPTGMGQDGIAQWACSTAGFWCTSPQSCTDCICSPHPCATCCDSANFMYNAPQAIDGILWNFGGIGSNGMARAMTTGEIVNDLCPDHCRPFIFRWGWLDDQGDECGGHFLVGHVYRQSDRMFWYLDPLPVGWRSIPGGSWHISSYDWVKSTSEHVWTHSLRMTTNGPCDLMDTVVCEGTGPSHPPTYWYDVTPGAFGRCDFHVQVFDPNPSNYTSPSLPDTSWRFAVRQVGSTWWASWWNPNCTNAIYSTFRFQFTNPNPSKWGHWTTTTAGSWYPKDEIVDLSGAHFCQQDGYGYRVHVPKEPDPTDGGGRGTLAMHTVATGQYLDCADLTDPGSPFFPVDCAEIDNSATVGELEASYGEVYVVFLAYDVEAISALEYCIAWPEGPGTPPEPTLVYCPAGAGCLGDPFGDGGLQILNDTVHPEEPGGPVGFSYFRWNALDYPDYLPLSFEYCASTYRYPEEPHNTILWLPGPDSLVVVSHHGCTIGQPHWEPVPYDDCATLAALEGPEELRTVEGTCTLEANRPNPFNPQTTIEYAVPRVGHVSLAVYDVTGRVVRSLVETHQQPGRYSAVWDGRDDAGRCVSSGVYFCRLVAGDSAETRKMILAK